MRQFRITWQSFDKVRGSYKGTIISNTRKKGIKLAKKQTYLGKIIITNLEVIL
jgi:hypothetical protein